ncbi:MAG: DinB family protein [Gemmatimonadota bacterium]
MPDLPQQRPLEALLDSWDRNNTILVNLLRMVPDGAFEYRPIDGSPSIAQLFMHMHYVRLIFVHEDVPEFAPQMPQGEWRAERNRERIAQMLDESARAVREAVRNRVETGKEMALHYDHPILMLQHMIWHEGYHHGQIKLSLKLAGHPLSDDTAGPLTWDLWMEKSRS